MRAQNLHPQANAEHGTLQVAQGVYESLGLETVHDGTGGPDARKQDSRRTRDMRRIGTDFAACSESI
jgi:hypothetical protein